MSHQIGLKDVKKTCIIGSDVGWREQHTHPPHTPYQPQLAWSYLRYDVVGVAPTML